MARDPSKKSDFASEPRNVGSAMSVNGTRGSKLHIGSRFT